MTYRQSLIEQAAEEYQEHCITTGHPNQIKDSFKAGVAWHQSKIDEQLIERTKISIEREKLIRELAAGIKSFLLSIYKSGLKDADTYLLIKPLSMYEEALSAFKESKE